MNPIVIASAVASLAVSTGVSSIVGRSIALSMNPATLGPIAKITTTVGGLALASYASKKTSDHIQAEIHELAETVSSFKNSNQN